LVLSAIKVNVTIMRTTGFSVFLLYPQIISIWKHMHWINYIQLQPKKKKSAPLIQYTHKCSMFVVALRWLFI